MFYNANELREYPFDEGATLATDAGDLIPEGLLADLSISIPRSVALRAFVSAISRTPTQTSIVIAAANAAQTPLAIASFPADYASKTTHRLRSLYAGVDGTFVPGTIEQLNIPVTMRFSNPNQSLLSARTVFPLGIVANRDYAVYYSRQSLQSIVTFVGIGDVEAIIDTRVLDGQAKRAMVLRLRESGLSGTDSLSRYAENQPRPESRTCGDPAPIESINDVRPDCCGRIYVELRGCAQPLKLANASGVVLDCPQLAGELCPPKTNFDPGPEQQNDNCAESGYPDPVNPPANQPFYPPFWSLD